MGLGGTGIKRFDVYYGMADNRIGVARLDVPKRLPSDGLMDPPQAKTCEPLLAAGLKEPMEAGAPFASTKSQLQGQSYAPLA